jgi:hypothetical protein
MALILDTNALSAAADHEASALPIVARAERLAVPVIVLGEFRHGIAQSRHRTTYENWLREWISSVGVLDIDEETPIPMLSSAWSSKRKASQFLRTTCGWRRFVTSSLFRFWAGIATLISFQDLNASIGEASTRVGMQDAGAQNPQVQERVETIPIPPRRVGCDGLNRRKGGRKKPFSQIVPHSSPTPCRTCT